ncbi:MULTISPECIES: hypothetical protein [unclassified Colwellia]|jgi:hypothetical protein|uniref:hypothetical protein n=1 Tax=unclassified Colwellia TaxID=196834 RepID=UPI0015F54F3D|nr:MULTISPECIES: hypothetical protein [unclassified Colwellia]MBA6234382.1 hypothetical protein [Colwellia sp. MB02u-7]MBA6237550.1 hypothetical protein [Colwellia sp. MB02u-11]MBA6300182.1 hypothetical protein [Colwellia sp. MB3u-22]MBA6312188.1 hypothetical protein [Colwellia sp. MB3u-64]
MNTVVKDWVIVTIIENKKPIGKVLYGIVIDDMSCRFLKGDYVCSSMIIDINFDTQLIKTESGSLYQIIENGKRTKIMMEEFELLRQGFNPEQIIAIRPSTKLKVH